MPTNNLLALKKTVFSLALCWTVLILVLCLVRFGELPKVKVAGADKYVHFAFHFVFTVLWGYYLQLKNQSTALTQMVKILALSILYGIAIEFLQETLTTTRHADIFDVLANTAGATTALLLFGLRHKIQKQ